MKLVFKQRMFSWFDSYDIFDEYGNVAFRVKGQLSWGHMFKIYNAMGDEVGCVKQKILTFLPRFEIYSRDNYVGCITKEFSFFKPKFSIDYNGWQVEGNLFEFDYFISDSFGNNVARVEKQFFNWTDTYEINVYNDSNALSALMLVIAIDAEKCSRD